MRALAGDSGTEEEQIGRTGRTGEWSPAVKDLEKPNRRAPEGRLPGDDFARRES